MFLVALVVIPAIPFDPPLTVAGAVRRIERDWLTDEDRDWILRNPKDTVGAKLHFSLGMRARNEFGLWKRNWILRASCGRLHPDDCSGVILDALWQSVRQHAPPATTRALDEQFRRVEAIQIAYAGFDRIRIGDVISRIQAQIDRQAASAPGRPLRLTVSGDPDLKCYTRADLGGGPAPLEMVLNWLSWRNGFKVRHDPPNVELVFYEKCCWPTPPHFATSSRKP